jgi:hypothetical protein
MLILRSGPWTAFVVALLVAAIFGATPLGGSAQEAEMPTITLPWEGGAVWRYMNGPHTFSGTVDDALDFQPPDSAGQTCESFTSAFWAVAAADGRATVMANAVEIDHGNGFRTGYYHLADKQVKSGEEVKSGQKLGRPGCCPDGGAGVDCWASEPHLHFYTSGPGGRRPIAGQHIGGWLVDADGCLVRPDRRACRGASLISNAPRFEAQGGTDVALTVALDVSASMDSPETKLAVSRLLAPYLKAAAEGEPLTLITFDQRSRVVRTDGKSDATKLIDDARDRDGEDATDLGSGLGRACEEMKARGAETKQALVLISDGFHNRGRLQDPARCFREHGWRIFAVSAGQANQRLLAKIAEDSGGEHKTAGSIFDPACELQRLRALVAAAVQSGCSRFLLMRGDRLSVPFAVPPDQAQASIVLNAASADTPPGVGLAVILRPPGGKRLLEDDVVAHESDGRGERYAVARPASGTWEVVVSGRDLPEEGVLVDLSLLTTPLAFDYPNVAGDTPTPSPAPSDTSPAATVTPTPDPEATLTPTPSPTLRPRPTAVPAPSPTPAATAVRPTASPVP